MVFHKTFPRTTDKSAYPVWEEIKLSDAEEEEQEAIARRENIGILNQSIDDAKEIISDKGMKGFETNVVNMAIALFEKRASHQVYYKERKAKEKFDEKFAGK